MLKRILFFLLFLGIFLVSSSKAFASSAFSTDYNVTYSISQNANTKVNINVTISNLTAQYYTPTYEIQVGFKNIANLSAFDEKGALVPSVVSNNGGTNIKVAFNQRVVGLGEKHILNISFDTNEVSKNLNHVWEVNIPGLSSKSDFSSFNAKVIYPTSLGRPSFIKPNVTPKYENLLNSLSFTKDDLGTSGISITFGDHQIYGFNLAYHLGNSNLFPIKTDIALPPSTNYQDITIDSIYPKPVNVRIDNDGNWLAEYRLSPSQKINVEVKGKAKLNLFPKSEELTKEQISEYLKPKPYWESDSPKIKELAKELKTPQEIYNFVVKTLSYDYKTAYSSRQRLGAVNVLGNPNSSVCLEFTDLFIAIARASGIPAREVDGYANTQNTSQRPLSLVKDILHAWPEYYDFNKKAWVMIDPTWGNTTGGVDYFDVLDFDHFAFVVKGQNSGYPVPAGGYKLAQNANFKDVNVEIADNFNPVVKLTPQILAKDTLIAGFPIDLNVNIKNDGNTVSNGSSVFFSTNYLKPKEQTIYFSKIPPYGNSSVQVRFLETNFLTYSNDKVKITFENKDYIKEIKILPVFFYKWVLLGGLIFVALLVISIIIKRSRRIHLPR